MICIQCRSLRICFLNQQDLLFLGISLSNQERGAHLDERVITIEGTDKQIEQANYLLRQAVRDHHSGGGGGRGGY